MTIQELLDVILTRIDGPTSCSIFEAVREVQGIIARRLLDQQSELIKSERPATLIFKTGDGKKPLPGDFWQLEGRPFVDGQKPLAPVNRRDLAAYTQPGEPQIYEVIGKSLFIYPSPTSDTRVTVPYFYKPDLLTQLTDELYWYGEFDSVFIDGCVYVLRMGLSAVSNQSFIAMVQSQVDAQLRSATLLVEQQTADALNNW